MGFPVVIISMALGSPMRRGSRCVPPAPGIKSDLDFGLPEVDTLDGHAVVAGHGRLQPSSQTVAIDGRNERLWAGFNAIEESGPREGLLEDVLPVLHPFELGDVSACNESSSQCP